MKKIFQSTKKRTTWVGSILLLSFLLQGAYHLMSGTGYQPFFWRDQVLYHLLAFSFIMLVLYFTRPEED